jgi:hypothetical protein
MTASASGSRPARRLWRCVLRVGLGIAVLGAGWLTLVIHPQPLFAHTLRRANVILHARSVLPPEAVPILDDVVARIARSPLYDATRDHDVFLCDTPALFAFFAPDAPRVGGVAHLDGNVFVRPANIARNRVIGPSGDEKPGERTLAYFIAHEVTHAMTSARVGPWGFQRLAAFQKEGYADHVAYARPLELASAREQLRRRAPEMDVRVSGLYRKYELMVAWLLERQGMSVDELLSRPRDPHDVERQLEADQGF